MFEMRLALVRVPGGPGDGALVPVVFADECGGHGDEGFVFRAELMGLVVAAPEDDGRVVDEVPDRAAGVGLIDRAGVSGLGGHGFFAIPEAAPFGG
jgi:hypothetical protein